MLEGIIPYVLIVMFFLSDGTTDKYTYPVDVDSSVCTQTDITKKSECLLTQCLVVGDEKINEIISEKPELADVTIGKICKKEGVEV